MGIGDWGLGSLHDGVEIEVGGLGLGDGGMRAVIDDLGRAHGGAGLGIIEADAVAAAGDVVGLDTVAAEGVHGDLADFVLGQFAHVVGVMAVIGEADGHVGLPASGNDAEGISLDESVISGRAEPQHDFSEGDNF